MTDRCTDCNARYGICLICRLPAEDHDAEDQRNFVAHRADDDCNRCEVCDDIHHGRTERFDTTEDFIASLEQS